MRLEDKAGIANLDALYETILVTGSSTSRAKERREGDMRIIKASSSRFNVHQRRGEARPIPKEVGLGDGSERIAVARDSLRHERRGDALKRVASDGTYKGEGGPDGQKIKQSALFFLKVYG